MLLLTLDLCWTAHGGGRAGFHPGGRGGGGLVEWRTGFFLSPLPTPNLGGGGGGWGGISPLFFANTEIKSKLNHEICHQGIINSWLYYLVALLLLIR